MGNSEKITCPKCGSINVKIVDGDFGRCLDCGAKMILSDCEKPSQVAVRCDKCGSNDVDIISEDLAVCRHCGTKIILNVGKNKVTNVVNNVNIVTGGDVNSISTYAVERNLKAEDFFRDALIKNYAKNNVPVDFIDLDFQPVKSGYANYFIANFDANVSYSVTLGYDREETYQEWNDTAKKMETKTRKVTDWRPFSGTGFDNVDIDGAIGDGVYMPIIRRLDYDNANVVPYNEAAFSKGELIMPYQQDLEKAKELAVSTVGRQCERRLPGDREKDFRYSGNAQMRSLKVYAAPTYAFDFEDGGATYTVNGFAFGNVDAYGSGSRYCDYLSMKNTETELKEKNAKMSIRTKKWFVFTLIASLLSAFAGVAIAAWLSNFISVVVAAALVAVFCIVYRIKRRIIEKAINKERSDADAERKRLKIKKTQEFLAKKGLKPLEENEKSMFF